MALVAVGLAAIAVHREGPSEKPCRLRDLAADASGVTAMHQSHLVLDLGPRPREAACLLVGPLQVQLRGGRPDEVARGVIYTTDDETGQEAALTLDSAHAARLDLFLGPSSDTDGTEIVCEQQPNFEVREISIRRLNSRPALVLRPLRDRPERLGRVCGGSVGGGASGRSTHPLTG